MNRAEANNPMTDNISVENVTVLAGEQTLIDNVSFKLRRGELAALLGPNGAGKTTALRAALGLQKIDSGVATISGDPAYKLSPMQRARRIAYLPQARPLAWPNTVKDIVALGRFSHGAALGNLIGADLEYVDAAILACDIEHLKDRQADTLSGGELARVHCARAIAARAPLLIADEPVAALDPRHQFRVMDLIKAYVANGGGALVVLHDVALAAKYADRLIFMKDGRIVRDGKVEETLSAQNLSDIYGVKADVDGRSVVIHGAL